MDQTNTQEQIATEQERLRDKEIRDKRMTQEGLASLTKSLQDLLRCKSVYGEASQRVQVLIDYAEDTISILEVSGIWSVGGRMAHMNESLNQFLKWAESPEVSDA